MKNLLLNLGKTPLFFLRWLNAAIMRILPSTFLLLMVYNILHQIVFGVAFDDIEGNYPKQILLVATGVAIVWGFLFVVAKPSLIKIAYIFRQKPVFGRSIGGRVAMCLFYGLMLDSTMLSMRLLGLFCLAETIINIIILNFSKKMPYNEALEKMCFKEGRSK